jgi:hypothetical protein
MIGYEMGSTLTRVYTKAKLIWWRTESMDENNDMATDMATLFVRGVL